jgi:hypothetical protein
MVYFFIFMTSFFHIAGELLKQLQSRSYLLSFIIIPLLSLRFLVAVSVGLGINLNLRKSSLSSSDKKKKSLFSFFINGNEACR